MTHLARPIDLRYPSNRIALAVAGLATVLGWFASADLGRAVSLGIAAFLAWAIGRELDPDDATTAAAAAVLTTIVGATVSAAGGPRPSLGGAFAVLLAARVTVRSTGRPPTPVDLAALVGIGAFVARDLVGWTGAMTLAFGLAWDRRLPSPAPWIQTLSAFVVAAAATARLALAAPTSITLSVGPLWGWSLIVLALASSAPALRPEVVTAPGDLTGEPLDPRRVLAARALAVAALVASALLVGPTSGPVLLPVAAALAGTGIGHLRRWRRPDGPRPLDRS